MKSFVQFDKAIKNGEKAFQAFIKKEQNKDTNFFQRRYWCSNGKQLTVLNYLIHKHEAETGRDMSSHIGFVLRNGASVNSDEPVHLVLQLKKLDLLALLTKEQDADLDEEKSEAIISQELKLDTRDYAGRTLLSRALAAKALSFLQWLLDRRLDVHEPNLIQINTKRIEMQLLHEAVLADLPEAINALLESGANIENPCGVLRETPLLLAAHYGRINSLEALLASRSEQMDLEAESINAMRPIDWLCTRLQQRENPQNALRGIARLLCHGAEVPRHGTLRELLMDNRLALLEEVKEYTKHSPALAATFVRACHDKNNPLHGIIYASSSWVQTIRRMFGMACKEAFLVESLVFDGFYNVQKEAAAAKGKDRSAVRLSLVETESSEGFSQDEQQFAEFAWRYRQNFSGFFKNPFSTMHWNLTSGQCTAMKDVEDYGGQHHKTRTKLLLKQMHGQIHELHDDLYEEDASSCSP